MVVVRKSAIAQTGNWFQRNSTSSNRRRRSPSLDSKIETASTDQALPVPSKKQRRSPKKMSLSVTGGLSEVTKASVPQVKSQSNRKTSKNQQAGEGSLPVMTTAAAQPFWLVRLYTSHRYSSVVTFLLVTATLCVYGLTVYSQEKWGQGYNRLQNLQVEERQLTTTNATLKNKMAEEAEQEATGLISPTPARTIFLPPASATDSADVTQPRTLANPVTPPNTPSPLGY
ncbi:hypothetical protein VB620_10585 [Nodularia harveyana UHCC-0300]|uniref:Cell division protein FtsL n=1 Tax=Nodularia harveyana UHCC-0300 TaxID=2974287 RepID=A0ABU5UE47_9CYAN|nr:hypothetical protein [Nodularia harveyana]MEA5581782.1 hypothetical protein [Nodularia harveyana UHCC-0300]